MILSKFLSDKYKNLVPYTPGEQPKGVKYIKLNTNESPYPPSPKVVEELRKANFLGLKLYSDPISKNLRQAIAEYYELKEDQIVCTNGSDEALAFAYIAYFTGNKKVIAPDISYGFYPVLSSLIGVANEVIPLKEDFCIDVNELIKSDKHIIIANPNAPTGIALALEEMEQIISSNANRLVIVDEAYVDFGGESCIKLIDKYPNLLVVQTFSKSRSLAGARIGFAAGQKELIDDLEKIRNSFNPYNVNALSQIIGIASIKDTEHFTNGTELVIKTRSYVAEKLISFGFEVLPSSANFLFARHKLVSGKDLYLTLKKEGVLVRHFDSERIKDFVRISIGSLSEMEIFLEKTQKIIKGEISL
jgi:histidinol-phosphate aminotransferase